MVESLEEALHHGLEGNLLKNQKFREMNPKLIDVKI